MWTPLQLTVLQVSHQSVGEKNLNNKWLKQSLQQYAMVQSCKNKSADCKSI